MSEFPRAALEAIRSHSRDSGMRLVAREAIAAYDELAERCVMDRTEYSLQIAQLRARLAEREQEAP